MDILWTVHPGADPVALLEKYPERFRLMHLKDLKKGVVGDFSGGTPKENDVVLGTGQIDIPAVFALHRIQILNIFISKMKVLMLFCQVIRILISIVGFTIIIIMRHYLETYDKMLINLRSQNDELQHYRENLERLVDSRTSDLEAAIEELKAINEELHTKNTIINDQNFELTTTMEDLKEAQTKLIQAEKMASLGVLTAGLAHEINNPLNFITGGYYGLNEYFQETGQLENEDVILLLSSIKTGADRAVNIVKGLTQFSRSDDLQKEIFDLKQVLDNCLIILYNQYKNHIEVVKRYPNEKLTVYGNLGQLHQVFMSVLLNAIQAIKGNGLITIELEKYEKSLVVNITDSGHGIDKNILHKITDPFFTTKEPGEGTGLGLSIAYSVVKDHNGSIAFDSELGKGTTVNIRLPLT
jgi:C4-dicarboxylate-specific signal transduction histidine kinase